MKFRYFSFLLVATVLSSGAGISFAATQSAAPQGAAQSADASEDQRLQTFLDNAFDEAVRLSPQSMTALGLKTDYDKLDDYTDAQAKRQLDLAETHLRQMQEHFDYAKLSSAGRLNYDLFVSAVEEGRDRYKWRWHGFPVSTNLSPAGHLPIFLINQHRIGNVADAEAYISRLREVERVMKEVADGIRYQASIGVVPPELNFVPVRTDAQKIISGAPFGAGSDNPLLADFKKKVGALSIGDAEKARLLADANEALTGPFLRGYQIFLGALDDIASKAKGNDGAWSLPQGREYYDAQLRHYTTTSLSADQVHQIGLDEVARIQGEMEKIKARVGFTGTLQEFLAYIKNDGKFKYPNTNEGRAQYLADAKAFIAQAMAKAPTYFEHLPKAPLEVRAVEEWRQETAPIAFYNRPAPDGSRPGIYYVNLADMGQVLKPQIESISYHEGAPGHHFQLARAQELPDIPKFRRFGSYGAYIEGWGLYAERLTKEMGFYNDPYSNFGRLGNELWRAVRLVVDTGIHAKKWSREKAIQYFKDNSLVSDRDIVKEVERYINWPGQATSYKIGELKILELRQKAQNALGDRFDIRDFHETILQNGALPLDMLEVQVDAYIASKKD